MVILATELTIAWNKIQGVNDTKSVGQLIPLMIGVGAIGHVLLVAIRGPKTLDEITQEYYQGDPHNTALFIESEGRQRERWWRRWWRRRRGTSVSDMSVSDMSDVTEAERGTPARTSGTTSIVSQFR